MNFDPDLANKLLAGGSGSAIAAWLAKLAGWNLVIAIAAGLAISWFLGPAIADFFDLHKEQARSAVSFMVGFIGLILLRKLLLVIETIKWEEIAKSVQERIKSWFNKSSGDQNADR